MKTIGVAIPCYYGHINKLKRLFDSIDAQTLRPNKVVVSCSSSSPLDIPPLPKYSFDLQIITTPHRKNAAENRNIAIRYLNTDLISFFDADDVMHPQRLEALQHIEADLILHGFVCSDAYTFDTFPIFTADYDKLSVKDGIITHTENLQFACAHVSVSSRVLQHVQFDELNDYETSADTKFCVDVINARFKSACIPSILSKGDASFTCFFEQGIPVALQYSDGQTVAVNPPPKKSKKLWAWSIRR